MQTVTRQTIVRMEESLYQRVKSVAKSQNRSVNGFINHILNQATINAGPKLDPAAFAPSKELLSLGKILEGTTRDAGRLDAKARRILSK